VAKAPPPHAPPPAPPAPIVESPLPPTESFTAAAALLPTPAPPVEPIPPGAGGYAQSPSTAERREKAEKEASQSAFKLRPLAARSGVSSPSEPVWFYWTLGGVVLLALMLSARGLRSDPRPRPATIGRSESAPGRTRRR
jgi:hypothetical protein